MTRFLVVLFYLAIAAGMAAAAPLILLISSQPKCMSVEAPADAILTVEYEAPDFVPASERDPDGPEPTEKWARDRKRKSLHTFISIYPDEQAVANSRRNHRNRNKIIDQRRRSREGKQDGGPGEKVKHDVTSKTGSVDFTTLDDGKVMICVQALAASSVNPFPVSIKVTESPAGSESVGSGREAQAPGHPGATAAENLLDSESQKNAKEHFSMMEQMLSRLISKTDMILRQADYAKELEVDFHEQSIAMNRASQWWPIVQLCVLLMTGFTQANHMIQFFKKHHIF